jgi:hypothetical protein
MMLRLIPSLLCIVSAQTDSTQTSFAYPVYSSTYLRGLKNAENKRLQSDFINNGFTYIKNAVFTAAKQGFSHYTTDPIPECDNYDILNEFISLGIDKENCNTIINEIKLLVYNHFPDTKILYDYKTKQYTLIWD